jgi:hypothetical protein
MNLMGKPELKFKEANAMRTQFTFMYNLAQPYYSCIFLFFDQSVNDTATCDFDQLLSLSGDVKQLKDSCFACNFCLDSLGQHVNDT